MADDSKVSYTRKYGRDENDPKKAARSVRDFEKCY